MKSTWTRMAILLALAGLLALHGAAAAGEERSGCPGPQMRPPGPPGEGGPPGHHWERLAEELGLTAEQQAQLHAVLAEELPAARERLDARIAEFLTPEQRAEFERLSAVRGAGGPGLLGPPRNGRGPAAGRLAFLARELDLTEEQQAEIEEILSRQEAKSPQEVKEAIAGVLTEGQRERFERLPKGPGGPPRGDFHRGRPGPPAAEAQAARMAEQLSLTDEQQAAVRELLEQGMSAAHQRLDQRIAALLTPEQRARWESQRQEELPPAAGRSGQYPE